MVRGQHQVDRLGLGLGGQLDEAQLIEVASEQKVPAPVRHVKHQAAGVVRAFGVPVWRRMEHRELRRAVVPGYRGGDRSHGNAVPSNLLKKDRGLGILIVLEAGRDHNLADPEPVHEIGKRIVMILVGVAEIDAIEPAEVPAPESRGDDPAPTRGSPMRPQS